MHGYIEAIIFFNLGNFQSLEAKRTIACHCETLHINYTSFKQVA